MTDIDGRDYAADMDARIASVTSESGWVAGIVAEKLHAELLETDLDLLDGWLRVMAVSVLRMAIGSRSRVQRTVARQRAGSRAFRKAAGEAQESGDFTQLSGLFAVDYVVDAENTRKQAADMTGPEHLFVAGTYRRSANESLMLAAFHKAVAKRVGDRKTSDVFSADQYEDLYQSITRKAA